MMKITQATSAPSSAAVKSINAVDPRYQIVLDCSDANVNSGGAPLFPMTANIPEKFSISLDSTWDTPFTKFLDEAAEGALGAAGSMGSAAQGMMQATGMTTKFKYASAQVWQSTSALQFSIPFVFVAVNDPQTEVLDKIKGLLKLVAPSEGPGSVLIAPGPTLASVAADAAGVMSDTSRIITLNIGNIIRMTPAIVTGVQCDIDAIMHTSGRPMFATANVEVTSFYTSITTQDLDKMFI